MVADETTNGGASTGEESPDSPEPDPGTGSTAESTGDTAVADDLAEFAAPVPWGVSVLAGGVAYVLGYLVTALLFFVGPASFGEITALAERLKVVGFVFNNQHFVDVVARSSNGELLRRVNIVLESGGQRTIPTIVYFAIPVVVLLGVSVALARTRLSREDRYPTAVLTAFGLTVGYVVLMFAGTLVFVRTDTFGNVAAVDTVMAVAAGIVYPLVIGAIGCVGSVWLLDETGSTGGTTDG